MATITLMKKYRHSEDCKQEGCPFHEAKFTYQSTSDGYSFDTGTGREVWFERGELEVFLRLLSEMYETDCTCIDLKEFVK